MAQEPLLPLDPEIAEPPKRGPGRPKKARPDEKPDLAAVAKPRSMAKELGAVVDGLNQVLTAFPVTRDDALSGEESKRLVDGLDRAQQTSPRVRRLITRGTEGSGLVALALALVAIAIPRLARHGLLPGAPRLSPAEERAAAAWMAQGAGRQPTPEEWASLVQMAQRDLDLAAAGSTNGAHPVYAGAA